METLPPPLDLDQLKDYLDRGVQWKGMPIHNGKIHWVDLWADLPTFGSTDCDPMSAWSWDDHRVLIGSPGNLTICPRTEANMI